MDLAVAGTGSALISWTPRSSSRTIVIRKGPHQTWRAATSTVLRGIASAATAVSDSGAALVVGGADDPSWNVRGLAFRWLPGRGWLRPVTVGHGSGFDVALNAHGQAIVAWQVYRDPSIWIEARAMTARGRWGVTRRLSDRLFSDDYLVYPYVAIGPGGVASVIWDARLTHLARRSLDGSWSRRALGFPWAGSAPYADREGDLALGLDAPVSSWNDPHRNFRVQLHPRGGGWTSLVVVGDMFLRSEPLGEEFDPTTTVALLPGRAALALWVDPSRTLVSRLVVP